MTNSPLSPRKAAQQERSRLKVEKILSVTRKLLTEAPAHQVTTIAIAEQAGISVGTLYQFFPNKEAIFYELFRKWLEDTLETLDRVSTNLPQDATREDCVDMFLTALCEPHLNSLENWKLRQAMGMSQALVELEESHLREVLERIYKLQARFGTPAPEPLVGDLMLLQNEVTIRCLFSLSYLSQSPNRDAIFAMCKKLLMLIYDYPSWNGLPPK